MCIRDSSVTASECAYLTWNNRSRRLQACLYHLVIAVGTAAESRRPPGLQFRCLSSFPNCYSVSRSLHPPDSEGALPDPKNRSIAAITAPPRRARRTRRKSLMRIKPFSLSIYNPNVSKKEVFVN